MTHQQTSEYAVALFEAAELMGRLDVLVKRADAAHTKLMRRGDVALMRRALNLSTRFKSLFNRTAEVREQIIAALGGKE